MTFIGMEGKNVEKNKIPVPSGAGVDFAPKEGCSNPNDKDDRIIYLTALGIGFKLAAFC